MKKNLELPEIPINIIWRNAIPKGMSLTPRHSPRCMLKIPDRVRVEETLGTHLPSISKSQSAANTPIRASPRIAKDKNYEFPDFPELPKRYNVIVSQDAEIKSSSPRNEICENYDIPDIDAYLSKNS